MMQWCMQARAHPEPLNDRPIIGVLTQYGMKEDEWFLPHNSTYIASSYVRVRSQKSPKTAARTQPHI